VKFLPADSDHLLAVARRWLAVGWQRPDAGAFRRLHAESFVDHSAAGRPPDRGGFWAGAVGWLAAFPDLAVTADDLIASPVRGLVTVRWSAAGTHRGPFLGFAPTGRRVAFTGIEIIRIDGGRVVERWGEWNGAEIVEQLRGGLD
jgi:predicted ester cyclase